MGSMLIIPKCSLCLFAVSNTIAVCGIAPMVTPLWEYLLVGFFALVQVGITIYEMRRGWKLFPILVAITGLAALIGFLFLGQSSTFYYAGVLLLSLGWIILRVQNLYACKSDCASSEAIHLQTQP